LTSPEACDNPLGYKFSWSPIGALNALNNPAKYTDKGTEMNIPSDCLLYMAKAMNINMALRLEGYPNRDSTKFLLFLLFSKSQLKIPLYTLTSISLTLIMVNKRNLSKYLNFWINFAVYIFKIYRAVRSA
jgi:hypothetical protein